MGYWAFLVGVALGFLGLLVYYLTTAATMSRGAGYALVALAPALLLAGAVLRFPLRKTATTLAAVGLALTLAAIGWFLVIFPGGWSLTTGDSVVILSYVAGLAVIGVAGSIVSLATERRDDALSAAEQRAESAETATDAAADAVRASVRAATERKVKLTADISDLAAEIVGLRSDNDDLRSSKAEFELYTDKGDHWRWRLVHDNGNIIADSGEGTPRSRWRRRASGASS